MCTTCARSSDMLHERRLSGSADVIGIGAPLSEELLFRGFLFSALAKSRLGSRRGRPDLALWTLLHVGYSIFGLIEVFVDRALFLLAAGADRQPVGHDVLPCRLQYA